MKQKTLHKDTQKGSNPSADSVAGPHPDASAGRSSSAAEGGLEGKGEWTAAALETFERNLRRLPLTPSQQALASVVLDNPERVAMSTIHALAADLNVNESTIARFALALELKGYAELRSVCRALARNHAGMLWRFTHADGNTSSGNAGIGGAGGGRDGESQSRRDVLAAQDGAAIASSFARIDETLWCKAVTLLSSAKHVCVMGLRQSQPVASMMAYLLALVRSEVRELSAGGVSHVDALRDLGSGDCVVAIATRPCSNDTVKVARWAREHGVPVIAITDEVLGPLGELADDVLLANTDSDAVLSSMTALVSIVQALANDVAVVDIDSTRAHLEEQERLLNFFEVYSRKKS